MVQKAVERTMGYKVSVRVFVGVGVEGGCRSGQKAWCMGASATCLL